MFKLYTAENFSLKVLKITVLIYGFFTVLHSKFSRVAIRFKGVRLTTKNFCLYHCYKLVKSCQFRTSSHTDFHTSILVTDLM